mmetsp:Transcript_13416/g.42275  ORF Transcript_13416/g.42275 Transcript_13416/m.42275 type:complete len:306 (-) Transcript_13416:367-1284(-)
MGHMADELHGTALGKQDERDAHELKPLHRRIAWQAAEDATFPQATVLLGRRKEHRLCCQVNDFLKANEVQVSARRRVQPVGKVVVGGRRLPVDIPRADEQGDVGGASAPVAVQGVQLGRGAVQHAVHRFLPCRVEECAAVQALGTANRVVDQRRHEAGATGALLGGRVASLGGGRASVRDGQRCPVLLPQPQVRRTPSLRQHLVHRRKGVPGSGRLKEVRAVKAVQAVGAEHAFLPAQGGAGVTEATLKISDNLKLGVQLRHEGRQLLDAHSRAAGSGIVRKVVQVVGHVRAGVGEQATHTLRIG